VAVTGRGWVVGGRVTLALPGGTELAHNLTAGLDAKRFDEGLTTGTSSVQTPIAYWPVSLQYGAGLTGEGALTQLGATLVFNLRPLGSGPAAFDAKRYRASASFAYLRGELSRSQELGSAGQLFGRVLGQLTDGPLLGSEGFAAGGAESVRGYREVEASGDLGVIGTLELRSPSVTSWFGKPQLTDGRLLVFLDAARLAVRDALPDQRRAFTLASAGAGARLRLLDHLVGSADLGIPLSTIGTTRRGTLRIHFRVAGDF
jgi:hemolysin activation/secretion protein